MPSIALARVPSVVIANSSTALPEHRPHRGARRQRRRHRWRTRPGDGTRATVCRRAEVHRSDDAGGMAALVDQHRDPAAGSHQQQ